MRSGRTLVIGIGSSFGDDQAGWRIVDIAADRLGPTVSVRRCQSPSDLLDAFEGVARAHICDACHGAGAVGGWRRWQWPSAELQPVRFSGSHDLGLSAALEVADQLGQLPTETILWGVEGRAGRGPQNFLQPDLSQEVEWGCQEVAEQIIQELGLKTED